MILAVGTCCIALVMVGALELRAMRLEERWIVSDPEIHGGTPVIRGTRLTVYALAGQVNGGDSIGSILEERPYLTAQAIRTAVRFAHVHPMGISARPWKAGGN